MDADENSPMRLHPQRLIPAAGRAAWKQIRLIVRHLAHELDHGQLNLHAMSLSFTTLLSLAPLLAVSFSVLKAFGAQDVLHPFLLNLLEPLGEQGEEIAARIVGFVENIRVGVLGAIGVALLFYTVIALMQKVERAFNDVWRVREDRPLAQRFTHYLSVLVVGPVLLFAIISALGQFSGAAANLPVAGGRILAGFEHGIERVSPYLMLAGTFAFIYIYVPNTRVRIVPALIGAGLAAVVWLFTGHLFADVVVKTGNYTAIYSAFAGLILFMLWLHLAWLILLLGASVSFALQNPQQVGHQPDGHGRPPAETALRLIALIAEDFAHAGPGWTAPALASRLNMRQDEILPLLERLHAANILIPDAHQPPAWRPAAALEAIPLEQVIKVAEGETTFNEDGSSAAAIIQRIHAARAESLRGLTLRELARSPQSRKDDVDLPT